MGSFFFVTLIALAAQDPDVDAGPGACDPFCVDGATLRFCDDGVATDIACGTLGTGAHCALLSDAWGADCVLGAGADCDPGYAFGASRCDQGASLFCIDDECTQASGPQAEGVEQPTRGTEIPIATGSTSPFGCDVCGSGQSALLVPALVSLRALSRRRRAR